ncbi:hypothetical protein OH76DRAFT_1480591 [Lentinus brumalis]|uniref:HAD-like protein n=1 Tax=Lentinus brumalis TaxID=2498619 RepID=A0A371DIW2_9APHY|nr:hypothetical protein OH76DRAFT_1480591 [Polyporus brumalis]
MYMSHTLLPTKFEPERSAYWLPKSGRLAASRLPTRRFWGLRACFNDDESDNIWPPYLFVVSSFPSPYPVEKPFYTLGPRLVKETGAIVGEDAEILTSTPIPTTEERASWPLFLHVLPALPINVYRSRAMMMLYYTLTEAGLQTFDKGVERCLQTADADAREALATHGFEKIKNGWNAPQQDAGHDEYSFGETIGDPHSYVFDFDSEMLPGMNYPSFEGPSVVYDELMQYNQLCKDYKWRGVDHAVDWVQDMRENARRGWLANPNTLTTVVPTEPCLDGELRERAMELVASGNPHVLVASVLDDRHAKRVEVANVALDSSHSSSSSEVIFLPWGFSRIPFRYPVVPFGLTKVILFDIFGTIMDREKAIATALRSWLTQSPIRHTVSIDLVVSRFLTFEAMAERDAQIAGSPASLATFARSALMELARDLELGIDEHSPFFTETLLQVLSPLPYPDVEATIKTLKERGYTLLCLPIHSATTMQQLRPSFPPAFADSNVVQTWTEHISAHFLAPAWFFSSLQSFCESLVKEKLQPSEILVVSSSVGRVLHAAMCAGHATAWLRRPGNLEGDFEFVVGDDENSCPVPSVVASGLMELIVRL